ncbi:MAG TPA: helix-hairpin-helix domain-containing protein [Ignavibacteria bacterium]|nr:helix-hairpin-helix domain-containing protein [Ignavibacteria bacterium]
MKNYIALMIIVLLNLSNSTHSQDIISKEFTDSTGSFEQEFDRQEEVLLEEIDSGEDDSELLDELDYLKKHPYDLNTTTLSQLENIPYLNSIISKKILAYRNEAGYFRSKRELLKVEGISEDLYEKIKIYLIVSKKNLKTHHSGKNNNIMNHSRTGNSVLKSRIRSRFLQDLQPKAGFLSGKYEGKRIKLYNQLNFKYNTLKYDLEANLTTEKDPGEKYITDFISGFAGMKSSGFIKEVIAGDYVLNFGQGLSMWTLQAFSKGADAINPVKKKGKGLKGYGSVNEVQFFRGGAVNINLNELRYLNFNMFYSDNYFDASSNIITGDIQSFYSDGYHRTSTEIQRKNSAREKLTGGRVSYERGSYRFGITYWQSKFSKNIIRDSSLNLFKISGNKASMAGADYDIILKNMNLFGEFALSQTNSLASVNGIMFTFLNFANVIISYRNYPADFTPVHSFGFSERGDTYNERGLYAGILFKPLKGLIINSYFDQYKFPYRTYFNPVPVNGNDFLTNAEWKISKELLLDIKYKNENKEETQKYYNPEGRESKLIANRNQMNIRTGFIFNIKNSLRFRSRFEYVCIEYRNFTGNNKGYLFYSDIRFLPVKKMTIDTRYIFFNTDSYDSRIYEFENDIQGVMSNVPLYGEGRRWYVVIKYRPFPFINLSAKYAETYFEGVKNIGSGNDRIEGNINNRFSFGLEAGF